MDEHLRKKQRLLKPAEFQRVFDSARRSRDRYFTILTRSGESDRARLGLAVSKKTDRRAVARNRIKRIIRESFRRTALATSDYVVISKPAAAHAENTQLEASLQTHWRKLSQTQGSGQ